MTAPSTPRLGANYDLNHLERGETYRAVTAFGSAFGEYLGMESPHGDRAILLKHREGTDSIAVDDITSIERAAA